jgi:hypothetical protein
VFLTIAELVRLTGYKRRGCMARWLRDNGFAFRIGADGYPRVLEDHVRLLLSGMVVKPRNTPNLAALKQLQGGSHGPPQKDSP